MLPLLSGELRPRVVAALSGKRALHFKTACITNNSPAPTPSRGQQAAVHRNVAEVVMLFDAVMESSKTGVRKPDPRIYQMMGETLKLEPADCAYIDDLGVNCKPAARSA